MKEEHSPISSKPGFTIPPEFQDQLRYRKATDNRSDAAILNSLTKYRQVTSEKNVWAFWDKGIEAMPGWCQRNVVNWVRLLDSSWTVRVLDSIPGSANYMLNYVSASSLGSALVDGTMDGAYFGQHSADMVRGACILAHGGVFMDVGIILTRDLDRICWNQLSDPNSPFQVSAPWMFGTTTANHFVAGRKGDPFIKRWHELFIHLWKDRTNFEGLIEDPLVSFGKAISLEDTRANNFEWDWKMPARFVVEYITQILCWTRVCMLEDTGDGFSGVDYWQNNVLVWDVLPENWAGEATLGFVGCGQKMFDLLSLPLDTDPHSEEYKEAYNFVWRLLTKSSMQKITHAKGLTISPHLGVLWDENPGKDCEPGTFGELLRYGTGHSEQTRTEIAYVKAPKPPMTMKKGVLKA